MFESGFVTGVVIGTVVLIVVGIAAFAVYGMWRDE